jgi:pimeloyl-ACP methyl ester carboxylesterase
MAKHEVSTGYSKNNLPYIRIGSKSQKLVIFEGLNANHKPPSGFTLRMMASSFKHFANDFTVFYIGRQPGLPMGCSMRDMSEDYAIMVRDELGEPVNIMGLSTGGPIAQYFAVDHPDLVRRLVLAMTGYRLTEQGAKLQKEIGNLIQQGKWRTAASTLANGMTSGPIKPILRAFCWFLGKSMFGSPSTPSDGLVEIEAEDKHNFKNRLKDIQVPTLVIGGDKDFFYPIRETAAGISNAKLILYKGVGHGAMMKSQFNKDVIAFLTKDAL